MKQLWKSLIQSVQDYGLLIWTPCQEIGELWAQEQLIRLYSRRIKGLENLSYWQRLNHLKLLSSECVMKGIDSFMFGILMEILYQKSQRTQISILLEIFEWTKSIFISRWYERYLIIYCHQNVKKCGKFVMSRREQLDVYIEPRLCNSILLYLRKKKITNA